MYHSHGPNQEIRAEGGGGHGLLMVVASAVNALVGQVLDGLDAGVRARFNRAGILFAVDDLGCATTLCDLREMFSLDGRRQDCNW